MRHPIEQDRFPTYRLWGRLLWKEWREGRPILAVGVALPLLTLPMSKREGMTGFDYSVMGLVGILLVLWAADRARRIGMDRGQVRQALPIPAPARWIFMHLVPLLVPALIGVAVGVMMIAWHPESVAFKATLMAAIFYLLSTFLLVTALTPSLSMIPAVIAGILWLFVGLDLVRWENVTPQFMKVILLSLVASLLWEAFSRAGWVWTGRAVVIVLLLTAFVTPDAVRSLLPHRDPSQPPSYSIDSISTEDHLISVEFSSPESLGRSMLSYNDRRDNFEHGREFPYFTRPLGFIAEDRVLLGRQAPDKRDIHLSVWNARTDEVREEGGLMAMKGLLAAAGSSELSPDGHYLLLVKPKKELYPNSPQFWGNLWMADLKRGRAVPVMANVLLLAWENPPAAWTLDRLYLSGYGIQVDLRTMRGSYLTPAHFGRTP